MATIKDVADLAGVSKSTASYAFNKPHLVKAATLDRILAAARQLNYQPNLFAQGLAGGKTQMIGLLVPDIRYPFNATIARGIEDRLRAEGYIVVTTSTGGDSNEIIKLMGQLHRRGVSGFIVVPSFYGIDTKLTQAIEAMVVAKIPVVVAGYDVGVDSIDQVSFRPFAGAKEAVDHLIELGHRHIAYLGGRHSQGNAISRFLAYKASHEQFDLPIRPELVIETEIEPNPLRQSIKQLFSLPQPPTAFFALNDVVVYAVLDHCYLEGVDIPNDLSIVSFDYEALVQRETPGITSVVVPLYDVGCSAADLLLTRFDKPEQSGVHIDLPYQFVIRESTASPLRQDG